MTPFTITDVGTILGIERLPGGDEASYNVVCPFCGDRRGKCNFVVYKEGEMANIYHCFHCDAAGNMLTLYADLTGLYGTERYKEAYHEIQRTLHFGVREQIAKKLEIHRQKKKQKEADDLRRRAEANDEPISAEANFVPEAQPEFPPIADQLATARVELVAARKRLFKPIFGCEMYVAPRRLDQMEKEKVADLLSDDDKKNLRNDICLKKAAKFVTSKAK